MCNASLTGRRFLFQLAQQLTQTQKKKKEKKKALSEGLDKWMQDFRLKNFPFKRSKSKIERNRLGKILSETR
jgi:hypothetical protein